MEGQVVNAVPSSYNVTKVKPPAVAAYKRRFVQPASSTAAATGGTYVRIPIPTGQAGTFLDPHRSFLQFKLAVTGATDVPVGPPVVVGGVRFAGLAGASACIQELRLYCAGQVVSEILNYNNVAEVVNDVTCGSGRSALNTLCTGAATITSWATTGLIDGNVGFSDGFNGTTTNNALSRTFTIPLLDGWVGLMAEKAFPSMLVAPGTLELEIKFATDDVAFQAQAAITSAASYTNIAFVGEQVILHSDVADAVLAAAQSGLLMYSTGYHTYQATTAAATSGSFIIPARALSANSFFWAWRNSNISTLTNFGLRRINPSSDISDANYKTFWLTIGTETVPQRSIQSYTECFAELSKALGVFSSKDAAMGKQFYFGTGTNGGYSHRAVVTTLATIQNTTACYLEGLDLDVFSLSSAEVRSGRNLQADQITYYWAAGGATSAATVDTILMHDVRLQFLPGGSVVPVY